MAREDFLLKKEERDCRFVLNASGFTLIEVMIAVWVLGFGILGICFMQVKSLDRVGSAKTQTEAVVCVQSVSDELMMLAMSDANLSIGKHPQDGNPVVRANVDARAAGYETVWEVSDAAQANARSIVVTVSLPGQEIQFVNVKPVSIQ
jgi:prepilin-type N-terminal cleavage/methylation domain-containing protein